jgi:hypothetical protein
VPGQLVDHLVPGQLVETKTAKRNDRPNKGQLAETAARGPRQLAETRRPRGHGLNRFGGRRDN